MELADRDVLMATSLEGFKVEGLDQPVGKRLLKTI